MTNGEIIERFGYDPSERLTFIGKAKVLTFHDGLEDFDFYYNASNKRIDVCYSGCNGTHCGGLEISDSETTLPPAFSKAFFEVKDRVPQGYRFEEKPWIGRIVATINKLPADYGHLNGRPIHYDIRYDSVSGSIDVHIVGSCCPVYREIIRHDGSTALPTELQEVCKNLALNPQLSIEEHNTSCEECIASLKKYQ